MGAARQIETDHTDQDRRQPEELEGRERFPEPEQADEGDERGTHSAPDRVGDADLDFLNRESQEPETGEVGDPHANGGHRTRKTRREFHAGGAHNFEPDRQEQINPVHRR